MNAWCEMVWHIISASLYLFILGSPLSRWLVRSGRKVLFNRIEVGRLLLRQPFHHLVLYPYLTNQL